MSKPVEFLDLDDLFDLARALLGDPPPIRDVGLLGSAAARPQTTVFGHDAYPDIISKAAALLQSIVNNHPLVDGNKRLGWVSLVMTLALNDVRLDVDDDEAFALTIGVAEGSLELDDIVAQVRRWLA